jgi:hypothetical protein
MALGTAAALGLGGAMGLGKYGLDQAQADRSRKAQAAIATYSPWTGMQASPVADPNVLGEVATGAAGIGALNQGFRKPSTAMPGADSKPTASDPNPAPTSTASPSPVGSFQGAQPLQSMAPIMGGVTAANMSPAFPNFNPWSLMMGMGQG